VAAEALTQAVAQPVGDNIPDQLAVTNTTASTASDTRLNILKRLQTMEQGTEPGASTTAASSTPSAPVYSATVVALGGNQFVVTVNGGSKEIQPKITIDVRVDGVSLEGSPFSFPQQ